MFREEYFDALTGYHFYTSIVKGALDPSLDCGTEWQLTARSVGPVDASSKQKQEMYDERSATIRKLIARHGHPAIAWAKLECKDAASLLVLKRVKEFYDKSK